MSTESIQTPVADTVTLGRVNQPPAQTWNRLHVNDITLTVPKISRKGDVYFALPQLFSKVETGMGEKVTAWVTSQAADARYVEPFGRCTTSAFTSLLPDRTRQTRNRVIQSRRDLL